MAEPNSEQVIKLVDPLLKDRPHLDFQFLRQKGLEHLGELSSQLWTDHNVHDPGITLLEPLCYALIDLGYRRTLPIEDLLAAKPESTPEDPDFPRDHNFRTPLESLSCNPTTIAD